MEKDDEIFQEVLRELKGRQEKLFFCLSKVTPNLDQKKKRRIVRPLASFLMSVESLNTFGVRDVYECLVTVDSGEIRSEILKVIAPYLDSLKRPAVVLAVRICSELADATLTPQMLKVFERSFKHFYGDHEQEIQENACTFFRRMPDRRSLSFVLKVAQSRRATNVLEALASIVDAYPEVLEEIYRSLEEVRDPENILMAFAKMKKVSVDFDRVLNLTIEHLGNPSISYDLRKIALKAGESAKSTLLRLAKSQDSIQYQFAINCLNEMGVTLDEIAATFDENVVLQVYEILSERNPKWSFNKIWHDRAKLNQNVRGDRLEYLVQNIFSTFNFPALYVDPTNPQGVDIVAFSPDTLHIYIVGCTTGIPTDDIPKLRSSVTEMKQKLPEIFAKYRVVPVIFTSRETDSEYSDADGMVILTPNKIGKLLEMLRTGRTSNDLNQFLLRNVIISPVKHPY